MTDEPGGVTPGRWRPSRAGILNVWRYYRETFSFHRGRLLLRGRNGTGKSKALELLLPFLLDASLRPNRLSTFGGGERVMHWNMIGHGYPGATRVGYVWLEFERAGASGNEYLTLGARLQATRDVSSVKATYFTASARVGGALALLTPEEQPLTVKQLKEAVEGPGHGVVHPGAEEYRSAVRSSLYPGLDQARYDALITALLQLRTPKLSERLDPGLLSSLLSSALPPLGHGELADIAGGFERLDRHREELRALAGEVEAAKVLADRQRVYASRVLRGAAAGLVSATGAMDRSAAEVRRVEAEAARITAESEELHEREKGLDRRVETLSDELRGLKDGDAYRAGAGIEILRSSADQAREEADARARDSEERGARAVRARARAREAAEGAARAERETEALRGEVARAAERADLAGVVEEAERALVAEGPEGVGRYRRLVRAAVRHRGSLVEEVRTAVGLRRERVRRREELESDLGDAAEDLADAEETADKAAAAHGSRMEDLAQAVEAWALGCVELSLPEAEALVEGIDRDEGTGPHAVVAEAHRRSGEVLAVLDEGHRRRAESLGRERAEVAGAIAELEAATEVAPVAPRTRTADRAGRPGAPLWRTVAFAEGVPVSVQAGVEAALEASGLLDAWIMPDGSVPAGGVLGDTVVTAAGRPVAGPDLSRVLVVDEESPVPAGRVRAILAGVAYTASGPVTGAEDAETGPVVAVSGDGHWRTGPVHGHWSKEEPAHIGSRARERARARTIAELTGRLEELDGAAALVCAERERAAERRRRLAADVAALPSDVETRGTAGELRSAQQRVADRRTGLDRRRRRLEEHLPLVATAERDLHSLAARHRLPVDAEALESVREALAAVGEAVENRLDRQVGLFGARSRRDELDETARRAEEEAEESAGAALAAEGDARALRTRLDTMEATVGVEHRRVQEQVAAKERRSTELRRELADLREERLVLREGLGVTLTEIRTLRNASATAVAARDAAAEHFRSLVGTSLYEDAGIDVPLPGEFTVRGTLETARAVASASGRADHSPELIGTARARVTEAVYTARDALSERALLELVTHEEIQQVSALVDGVRVGARGLHDVLVEEQRVRSGDLTEEERALFDRVLTGDTRRHLADRLRRAQGLVEGMNERLSRVRTASRIAVRLRWEVAPDAPSGTPRARELLIRDPRNLGEADRETLHAFFRERIDDARAEDTPAGWEEHLAQVLDYTAWHRFTVELDKDDGAGWQVLTRRAHGGLSGGEKAIALHLPLFAAVAAHYATDPGAPRFILLDEVFVGVDSANRGQIFALLVDLGLDMVLTSDHEWCTYAELDGIAIHQLIPAEPGESDDAVTTARWVWTGGELESDDAVGEAV
ncbi:TIGR02680 family protein [Nocardiopsis lambiniae]|uniref:TIGR02680 family protein n=1 Tax=Nocardiopsis lambiniae TaxID=3075539 RepID=A0ABU2MBK4_9ACTN|nr:TIGR02680 family protein [Nocardiopsis sp. DSM 44743]MDT0329992.1 TIGR02680 family protein [Nocardiopsis sp. DSM 44743]